jgi:hypothetical protein
MVVATAVARCAVRCVSRDADGCGWLPARYPEGIIEEQTRHLKETMMLAAGTGTAFTEDCHCVHEFTLDTTHVSLIIYTV